MTLAEFHQATMHMPGTTPIAILDFVGDYADCELVTIEDLAPGDPAREDFPPSSIVLNAIYGEDA
jgi:hypothetical protein